MGVPGKLFRGHVMTRSPSSRLAVFPILFLLAAGTLSPARGQTETGTIYGTVSDPTGAVIANATARLIDTDSGVKSEVVTGSGGFYTFASVRPGHYQMAVEKSGFKLARLIGITVNVQDNLEQNFKLDIGSASETVTVAANTANVNTTGGTVSTVVDRTFADNLPLNGRTFQTLIMLTPGVVVSQTAYDDQGQFSVNGQRADANYFTVDGVSANFGVTGYLPLMQTAGGALPATTVSGGTNSLVSVDAMQEFRVQTSTYAPEYGRMPGGQISIVTRSGSNAFHGTLFDYFRNDVLDANNWFNGYTNNPRLPKAKDRQNDFGGVFGGPIFKNRTFFFFSYEGLRLRQPNTQETVVPDVASRNVQTQVGIAISPYLNSYPMPNGPELGNGLAQFNASYSDPSSLNAYSIRVDQVVNSKINLFGRYNYSPSNLDQRAPQYFSVLSTRESLSSAVHTFTLGLNELISSRISNEVRANYSNQRVATLFTMDRFGGALPLPNSLNFPSGFSTANSNLEMDILGAGEFEQGQSGTDEQRQLNLIDNLGMVKRNHQLKFGVDYRRLSPFSSPAVYDQFVEFTGVTACSTQPCTETPGDALSDMAYAAFVQSSQSDTLLSRNFSAYAQDTWKATSRLTLTYGLRWELNPAPKGKNLVNEPFTVTGLSNPATIALAARGTPLYQTTYGNFSPRIGAAYGLRGGTNWNAVVRGGFGSFYDLGNGPLGGASSYFPFNAVNSLSLPAFPLSGQNASPPILSTSPPVSTIVVARRDLKLPRTYEWNAALETSLGTSQTLSATYVGAIGRDLLRVTNILVDPTVNPNFSFISFTDNSATSDYHALQLKLERRLSQGLQALASYTWSHSIDIASTDAAGNYLNTPSFIASSRTDRGNSDFDIRHAFTAGVTYSLPSPRWNNIAHAAFGGWSVDGFIFARTASPVNVIGGYSFAAGTAIRYRPNVTPGIPLELFGSQYPGGKIINGTPAAVAGGCPDGSASVGPFCPPPSGQQGNFSRNRLRAFGASQADIAFQRQFRLTERMQLRFRGEFFNIFNHPNFGPPIGDLTSSQFGYSTQMLASSLGSGGANGGLNPLYQIGGPRSIQLALKLQF
jgi:hypothetical protein